MKLSEMRATLDQRGIMLTKSLGQNFLHDENQLHRLILAGEMKPTDQVLEIGPGLGPLTEWLVAHSANVTAIEVDNRLCEYLRERFAPVKNLTLIHADALEYLKSRPSLDWSAWKLIANLPYSVASPILVELAIHGRGPSKMVTTVQREVAMRIIAPTDADDYGVLSLLLQLDYVGRVAFKIPSVCFFPEPGVESSVVVLERRPTPLLSEPARKVYARLVRLAFSQRRKMMLKLLKQNWDEGILSTAMSSAGLTPDIRAEKVSLQQFVHIARQVHELTSPI